MIDAPVFSEALILFVLLREVFPGFDQELRDALQFR
jgi:hypothetical protein